MPPRAIGRDDRRLRECRVDQRGDRQRDGQRHVLDRGVRREHPPAAERARPLERSLAPDVDREHPAHASGAELHGLLRGVAECFGRDDLERELLELTAARLRIASARIDGRVGRPIRELRDPGQHVDRDGAIERAMGLQQRAESAVAHGMGLLSRGHVDEPSVVDLVAMLPGDEVIVDGRQLHARGIMRGRHDLKIPRAQGCRDRTTSVAAGPWALASSRPGPPATIEDP